MNQRIKNGKEEVQKEIAEPTRAFDLADLQNMRWIDYTSGKTYRLTPGRLPGDFSLLEVRE